METTTVVRICRSTPSVRGSSTSRIALFTPAVRDWAWTLTVTGLFSGSETLSPPTTRKVPSALFARFSLWLTARSGPDVRVMVMSYVFFW